MHDHRIPATSLRVVVIDNDSGFVQVLRNRFERVGWPHQWLHVPPTIETLTACRAQALVIDPGVVGPEWDRYLTQVCQELPALAVVVCSSDSTVAQRVRGLRLGADDWVAKPCHPEEVVARIEAVTRRGRRTGEQVVVEPVVAGPLRIRADHFQAYIGDTPVGLTRREFELLALLAEADGRVLEREEIYQRVWGYAMAHGDRSVDVFVRKLRKKLEQASPEWRYLHTHFGVGYRFAPEEASVIAASPAPLDGTSETPGLPRIAAPA